jgi:hypothetical protein
MKAFFTTQAQSATRAVCAWSLLCFLTACAAGAPPVWHETDEQALEDVHSGKAVLDCGQPCADAWRSSQSELTTRYEAGDWHELAVLVMQNDYRQDLAYFYLGRAAEGLGDRSAALAYYKTAEALATGTIDSVKCVMSSAGCNGINLLTEVLTRIQVVDTLRGQNAAAMPRRQYSRPGLGPSADTPGQPATDNWVDPPPATP